MADDSDSDKPSEGSEDSFEETDPLFVAIADRDRRMVSTLLSCSPDRVNEVNTHTRRPPLHTAIVNNDQPMCALLIDKGANIGQILDSNSNTSLHVAAYSEVSLDIMDFLLKHGAIQFLNTKNGDSDVPLHITLEAPDLYDDDVRPKVLPYSQLCKARMLLDVGAEVNITNVIGDTPVLMLARVEEITGAEGQGLKEIAALLSSFIQNKADVSVRNIRKENILHLAAGNRSQTVLATMAKYPQIHNIDIHARDGFLRTPLQRAVNFRVTHFEEDQRKTELLLSLGASFDTWSIDSSVSVLALFVRKFPIMEISDIVRKWNISLDSSSYNRQTCLHEFCRIETNYFAERVEFLVHSGANVNVRDINGSTPLHLLCHSNFKKSKIFDTLVGSGADLSLVDNFGRTTMHYSTTTIGKLFSLERVTSGVLEQQIARGASVNVQDVNGFTPLHLAAKDGLDTLIETLLKYGADTSIQDCYGNTFEDYKKQFLFNTSMRYLSCALDSFLYHEEEDEKIWNPDEWKVKYWKCIPHESLVPRVLVPSDELDLWANRAKYVRGNPDSFVDHILDTPEIGQITDYTVIAQKIEHLVHRIAEKIAEIDSRFTAEVQLSGSNYEGTKTTAPDEFDFLFKLKHFSEEFEVVDLYEERKTQAFIKLKTSDKVQKPKLSDFVDRATGDLLGLLVINLFSYLLRATVSEAKDILSELELFYLGENSSTDFIPNIEVLYIGRHSEKNFNLRISIDVVPCFLGTVPDEWKNGSMDDPDATVRFKRQLSDLGCLVIPKNRTDIEVQQVEVYLKESNLIRALPDNIKDAYILLKLLKSIKYCPNFDFLTESDDPEEMDQNRFESDKTVSSYILKTAVCNVWLQNQEKGKCEENKSRQQMIRLWACRVLDWLETSTNNRELYSLDRPWEDLLMKADENYAQVPVVLAVCRYIRKLVQD